MRYDLVIEDMVWSHSRLTAFEQCPYQWFRHYILNEEKRSNFFSEYGSFMHEILQKHLEGELPADRLVGYFLTNIRRAVPTKAPMRNLYPKYLEQGRQYLRELSLPQRHTLGVEMEIFFPYAGGRTFRGFVDWLSEDADGRLYITDHKSRTLKARSGRAKPTKTDRELDVKLRQLYIYAAGVHHELGRWPDYLEFNCFRNGVWITEPFDPARCEEVESWAQKTIDGIVTTDDWYASVDDFFCKNLCDMRDCEYI